MAGLVFFFEDFDADNYSGRPVDLDAWYLSSRIPDDIDKILVINETDLHLTSPNADIDFKVYSTLPELEGAVYLDPIRGESLWELDHREVEWYVIGPARGWDTEDRNYLYIPQSGNGHCHSQHISTVVMFSRYGGLNGCYIGRRSS